MYARPKNAEERLAARYIPKDARPITVEGVDAVVYVYGDDDQPSARGFIGTASKATFAYYFNSVAQRDRHVENFFSHLKTEADRKAADKARRAAYAHDFQVGDIVYNSWGWEQTNIDFYQVTEVRGKQIVLQRIAAESTGITGNGMADHCVPVRDAFLTNSKPIRKTPREGHVSFEFGAGSKWDGTPKYRSWYA